MAFLHLPSFVEGNWSVFVPIICILKNAVGLCGIWGFKITWQLSEIFSFLLHLLDECKLQIGIASALLNYQKV